MNSGRGSRWRAASGARMLGRIPSCANSTACAISRHDRASSRPRRPQGLAAAARAEKRSLMLLWRHRSLIAALSRREIEGRYRGHFGGLFWYVLQNLVLLAIYTWVFGSILGARWSTRGGGEVDF